MTTAALARRIEELTASRVAFVQATVVRVERPTSVRPGDRAVVLADGTIEGFVGGVCAESAVRLHALRALETGDPLVLRLEPGEERAAGGDGRGGEGTVVERNPCLSGGSIDVFLEPCLPPPRMLVAGGEAPIAAALVEVARAAGYEVACGPPTALEPAATDAAMVVASHGDGEEQALTAALLAGVPYVALVASAVRGEAVRGAIAVPDELRAQLHTPAGLPIGARTAHEIAIAILAEMIATRDAQPRSSTASATAAPDAVRDPVCGMEVAVSEATPHLDRAGERIYFCGERCRDAYEEQHAGDAAAR
jgi:xanthine dehydrogenase accessory factor